MHNPISKKKDAINRVVALIDERLSGIHKQQIRNLTELFYSESIGKELQRTSSEDLYGAVLCLWDFLQHRSPGKPAIRAYNPNYEEHAWQSTHTIVEVATDDMPFLVASLTMGFNRLDMAIHMTTHPIMAVVRDDKGQVVSIHDRNHAPENARLEAVMRFEIDRQSEPDVLERIVQEVRQVVYDVRVAVEDWPSMRDKLADVVTRTRAQNLPLQAEDRDESLALLEWMTDNHFTFLGYRYFDLERKDDGLCVLHLQEEACLGTFRDVSHLPDERRHVQLSERLSVLAVEPSLLIITKSTSRSTVHRPAHLDYVGIKAFNEQGEVVGEHRFFGLFTSDAYSLRVNEIPLLRLKEQRLLQHLQVPLNTHKGRLLRNILDNFPRDEMLQASQADLEDTVRGILELEGRKQLRLFTRTDVYGRFVTAQVYVPKDRYNTELRLVMEALMLDAFKGNSTEFSVRHMEGVLARVHFTIHTQDAHELQFDVEDLEAKMSEAMLSWEDKVHLALRAKIGEEKANKLHKYYGEAFPSAYREDFTPNRAVQDILRLETLDESHPLSTYLYRPLESFDDNLRFKVFGHGPIMALSDVLPVLENMGVRVVAARPYEISPQNREERWMLDFDISARTGETLDADVIRDRFQDTFIATVSGQVESDGFNRLVVAAGLSWRNVVMLRAIGKYLLQIRVPFSQAYMEDTLVRNATITHMMAELFVTRFDPAKGQQAAVDALLAQIEEALEQVSNLDEDRILRHFLSVVQAMLRTNFYQPAADGNHKGYISFKLNPELIPAVPLPRPKFEIFVYSPWVEGVHLRGGKVARGGLRWSDRREDFRTEVLGLVKAQMVKNAVIVPVGAKGGFVCKQMPANAGRDETLAEGIRCYQTFIRALLDITDNLIKGEVIPPKSVVRYDEDDPYLVVAADKGTATFSDIANAISLEYGHWLGDAFASGGSQGYDHKKMGITARGAWESVKRLFREQGHDTQSQDFTVVGVGDMAGDVFGNGMLLSEHIRLVAAFNHMHIFIDPTPDAASSFVERKRMFELPRSSWADYNASLISKGGGIFERRAKSIAISAEMRAALGIEEGVQRMTPNELMSAILKAPVDLLWNGGIGTYVKAAGETHADVGDKANDAVRIDGSELRCKVVGEGGNLGFTQKGRTEFARNGGYVTTDAIDNSGGVDSSDHEVNIKILLGGVVDGGDMTEKQRNQLLASMTDEVAELVLRHNRGQSNILSLSNRLARLRVNDQLRLIQDLEKEGRLNRKLEYLPSDDTLNERIKQGEGFTRPEMAVLLAYAKIRMFDELSHADIASDPYLVQSLREYFPSALQERFAEEITRHPLRNEILATHLTNQMANQMGITFTHYLQEETNAKTIDILRCWMAARAIFQTDSLMAEILALPADFNDEVLADMQFKVNDLLGKTTLWLLRSQKSPYDVQTLIDQYAPGIQTLSEALPTMLSDDALTSHQDAVAHWLDNGASGALSLRLAGLAWLSSALDIVRVAAETGISVNEAGKAYFSLDVELDMHWLRRAIRALPQEDLWQRKARATLLDELDGALRGLSIDLIRHAGEGQEPVACMPVWLEEHAEGVNHCADIFRGLQSSAQVNLAMLSVAVGELRQLL
ncbi:NAD-glutamate dehydrogenase [Pokkaliibacter plantistimulans]|uniref:NAD-glutamate dehydrogenase n=1 Tax=Proteobacteria bacterium 228 TaxID=2083153 RepID=A0A2S5KNV1_9PROT|nr:NAD-glutamate dehydrogenase [Pokkaliibacter plantistimulans]PPC76527.1 NAD-glutamate dehydrogenase [Pokkaliibacter plantistimulans]